MFGGFWDARGLDAANWVANGTINIALKCAKEQR